MNAESPDTSGPHATGGGCRDLVLASALDTFARYGYRKLRWKVSPTQPPLDQSLTAAAGVLADTAGLFAIGCSALSTTGPGATSVR